MNKIAICLGSCSFIEGSLKLVLFKYDLLNKYKLVNEEIIEDGKKLC